jgi:acyl carrier protein
VAIHNWLHSGSILHRGAAEYAPHANGKINRPALPDPFAAPPEAHTAASTAPTLRALNDREQTLVSIWARLLGRSNVPIDADFFELGGHSLLATQAVFEIAETLHVHLPVHMLFEHPTVAGIAEAIQRQQDRGQAIATSVDAALLARDAADLDTSIIAPSGAHKQDGPATGILLTGCTGFLGAFLLRDLLCDSEAKLYCLVRADNEPAALARIISALEAHQLWKDEYRHRLVPLPGDLSQPLLGLSPQRFSDVSQAIDLILHNGAWLHWLHPYRTLKATNVGGTHEVLRLACARGDGFAIPVHFVSTTSVYDTKHHATLTTVREDDDLPSAAGIGGGYPQSKWVADKMMLNARQRGPFLRV